MSSVNRLTNNDKFKGLKTKVYQGDVDQKRFNRQVIYFIEQLASQNASIADALQTHAAAIESVLDKMDQNQEDAAVDNN